MYDFFILYLYFFYVCVQNVYLRTYLFTTLEMSHTVRYQAGCCDWNVCAACVM